MSWFRKRAAVVLLSAALAATGTTAVLPGTASAATCSTAGCSLTPGAVRVAYIDPADAAGGFGDLAAHTDLFTDASTLSYTTDSAGAVHFAYASGVFGTGTTGCTEAAAFQAAGGRVEALITNLTSTGWSTSVAEAIINNASVRDAFVKNVVTAMSGTGCANGVRFTGAEFDFEALLAGDRAGFTATVQALATALHNAGYLLDVSVYSKSSDMPPGFGTQDAQDWPAITAVADQLRLQGYGYCWESGCLTPPGAPPGPIGPYFWDSANVAYAVTAAGAAKVILGLPLYGIDWPSGHGTGTDLTCAADAATPSGVNGVPADVTDELAHYGITPSFETTDSAGNLVDSPDYGYTSTGHGRRGGTRGVFYTNGAMLGDILAGVVNAQGIAGAAFWRIGATCSDVWPAMLANG